MRPGNLCMEEEYQYRFMGWFSGRLCARHWLLATLLAAHALCTIPRKTKNVLEVKSSTKYGKVYRI